MINSFSKNHRFLSNFYPSPFKYDVYRFPTVEHFFQAYKAKYLRDFLHILAAKTPREAKRIGRTVEMREDWEAVKVGVMCEGVERKFAFHSQLGRALIATGNKTLIEGNTWHDNFWGDCYCRKCRDKQGWNILGTLLMSVRFNLQNLKR